MSVSAQTREQLGQHPNAPADFNQPATGETHDEEQPVDLDPSDAALQAPVITGLRSIVEIVRDLKKPLPESHLADKPADKTGSKRISYIPWYVASAYLDKYAPGWSYQVQNLQQFDPGVAVIVVRISIPCREGVVYREATGQERLQVSGYGDSTSNAESMALRRAAAKFGLGLYLYKK